MINLDNNATTRPCANAVLAAHAALESLWHNPSSIHRPGQNARHALELARADLASIFRTDPKELILTSGGTESIDLAIRGRLGAHPRRDDAPPVLVTTRVEHAAVRDLAENLARENLAEVRWAPVDHNGLVDPDALDALLDDRVALVSVQWANNETGAIQPVERIAERCRARRVAFHSDATQWAGKEPFPAHLPDLITISAHKFHGPKGVGTLRVRRGVGLRPCLHGTQELARRGGTENVPGVLGAGAAAREAIAWLEDPSARAHMASLRDSFEKDVLVRAPGAIVNAAGAPRLWNTSNIAFPGLEGEALLLLLSERGVCASAGAACSSGSLDPSPVLLAMGIPPPVAHGSIRFSLSRETTPEELREASEIVGACVATLRRSTGSLPTG